MFLTVCFIAVTAGIAYALYVNKKQILHLLNDAKYEFRVQEIGFRAMIDDLIYKGNNRYRDFPDVKGQVAVVTGGARGIGYHVVKHLVQSGMHVVLGVRNVEAGKKMGKDFKDSGYAGSIDAYTLDVSKVKSVEKFASIVSKEYPSINLLVNNAGIMFGDFVLTEDGFENQLATNYLGHFLLTHLLMPNLRSGGEKSVHPARVVNVSSCAHKSTEIFFHDINMKREYFSSAAYGQSKLAQIMSARYIDRLLKAQGDRVNCFSVHPGVVNTDLFQGTSLKRYSQWFMNLFFKSPEQGAIPILYASLGPNLLSQGGAYISNCRKGSDSKCSRNEEDQEKLFKITCEMLKVKKFGVVDM